MGDEDEDMKKFHNLIENAKNRIENLRNDCGKKLKLSLIDDIIEIKREIFPHFITDSEIDAERIKFSTLFEECKKNSIDKSKLNAPLLKLKNYSIHNFIIKVKKLMS